MPYQPTWANPYVAQQYGQAMPQMASPMQYQQPVNGITKVNGRDSALQYQLPPNSMSPALFDNNGKTFYIVSTDGTGMKTVEAFDFTPHVDKPVQTDGAQFVSRREFEEFTAKVNAALGALNGIHAAVPAAAGAEAYGAQGQHVDAPSDDAGGHLGGGAGTGAK